MTQEVDHASLIEDAKREWTTHQRSIENYELGSLAIKLVALISLSLYIIFAHASLLTVCLMLIFWGLDVIWKTFQQRTEQRILALEQYIASEKPSTKVAFQFHTQFAEQRGGLSALLKEYLRNSVKPTIAYPHAVLVFITMFCSVYNLL